MRQAKLHQLKCHHPDNDLRALARWLAGLEQEPGLQTIMAALAKGRIAAGELQHTAYGTNTKCKSVLADQRLLHAPCYVKDTTGAGPTQSTQINITLF